MIWKTDAVKHAEECMPKESCGLLAIIKGKETYWPCKNIAESGFEYFIINPDDWAECEDTGEIIGIVHSHPYDPPQPSDNDKASCEYLDLPSHIYSVRMKEWCSFEPSGWKAPSLIGRSFIWGVHDCWSIVTDWLKENKNIDIPHWKRPKTLKEFTENPEFEYALPKLNFIKQESTTDIQVGDVLLFQSVTKKLDHVAVYIGDNMILNHNIRRLSCREPFDLSAQNALRSVYRYAP
jgi:proteasome lid subunit RPN8/RPN11